jgi:hypothetical protein
MYDPTVRYSSSSANMVPSTKSAGGRAAPSAAIAATASMHSSATRTEVAQARTAGPARARWSGTVRSPASRTSSEPRYSASCSPPGAAVITRPSPVRISISVTDSCVIPLRSEVDSTTSPETAPPMVIVLSCGTTIGISPWRRVASARCSYVTMPPVMAVRLLGSTHRTWLNADTSSPGTAARPDAWVKRNRFEVGLASRTGCPGGIAAYSACNRSTAARYLAGGPSRPGRFRPGCGRRRPSCSSRRAEPPRPVTRATVPP